MREKQSTLSNYKIIRLLLDEEITTVGSISDYINLSEKTVRNRLDTINDFLDENQLGKIERKPRVGVWLEADEKQIIKLLNLTSELATFNVSENVDTRVYEMTKILLQGYDGDGILLSKLARTLYISNSTALNVLKKVEENLLAFGLKILNTRNHGFKIVGSEFNYRNAIKEFIFEITGSSIEENLINYYTFIDIHLIKKIISETEKEWGINFDEYSFNQVLVTIAIAIVRNRFADKLEFNDSENKIIEQYNEYGFATTLLNKILKYTGIEFSKESYSYIAMHILCSRFIENDACYISQNTAIEYDKKLYDVAEKMIKMVGNVLDVDFTQDFILFNSLIQHLRPMIFRLKYGIMQDNTLLKHIIVDYKKVYRAVWSVSILFEQFYNVNITEHEIGFITIYFQAALQRLQLDVEIILVTKRNASYTQLLSQNINKEINVVKDIEVVYHHDFNPSKYDNVDIILTTDDLHYDSNKVIEVNNLHVDKSIELINAKLSEIRSKRGKKETKFDLICHQLFDPELIFIDLKVSSKLELIKHFNEVLMKKNLVTAKYEETVINHESITVTEIGNGIAIPHGSQHEVLDSKIAVAILDEPILWNTEKVDVVFLLVVKMTTSTEIKKSQLFYKGLLNIIDSDKNINILRNMTTSIDLFNYLIS